MILPGAMYHYWLRVLQLLELGVRYGWAGVLNSISTLYCVQYKYVLYMCTCVRYVLCCIVVHTDHYTYTLQVAEHFL